MLLTLNVMHRKHFTEESARTDQLRHIWNACKCLAPCPMCASDRNCFLSIGAPTASNRALQQDVELCCGVSACIATSTCGLRRQTCMPGGCSNAHHPARHNMLSQAQQLV